MSKKRTGFDWIDTLQQLKTNPVITTSQYEILIRKAGNWPTCACGQLCKALPKEVFGEPEDQKLQTLGMKFYGQVERQEWCLALETFYKIECRSAELLKQQRRENNNNDSNASSNARRLRLARSLRTTKN